jgi:uncharacterized membrane protein
MENTLPRRVAANPTQYNIDAIAKLEHQALHRRTPTERVSDAIAKLVGNIGFLLAHLLLIFGWSMTNLHIIPGVKAFDPFPFGILALVVSSEIVFLTIFVLISPPEVLVLYRKRAGSSMFRNADTPPGALPIER